MFRDGAGWWIKDLGSSNGTYLNGSRIQLSPIPVEATIEFFAGGPIVQVSVEPGERVSIGSAAPGVPARQTPPPLQTPRGTTKAPEESLIARTPDAVEPGAGKHILRKHRRRFAVGMTVMGLLLAGAVAIIVHQQRDRSEVLNLARQIFYQTKSLEVELAKLKLALSKQPSVEVPPAVQETDRRLREMQQRYASLTEEMKLIGSYRSKDDLLIFRIARVFGEYDLSIPDDFVAEVKRYIRKWKQTKRLENTMARINSLGRAARVVRAMRERELPAQFLYLALQESDFNTDAIGPETRFGIPKGMWQFLPQTAVEYGLAVGPEQGRRVFDPRDERFDFEKSTDAAADYLQYLYTTEAQASGLLVMSAYNWGHGNLRRKLSRLPQTPEERNFWRMLQSQQIPDETYGYVLNIVAAAVIGEDPAYFGFSFENPLKGH